MLPLLKKNHPWVVGLIGSIFLLLSSIELAFSGNKEIKTSDEINRDLNYLLTFVGPSHADCHSLESGKISEAMKFVTRPKEKGVLYFPDDIDGLTSTYHEVDIARSLDQILQLTENPQIPAVFTAPSTIRMSRWQSIETPDHQRPKLWEYLPKLDRPLCFSGIEHVVNTPDQHTGAYYEYDLYRSVILTKYNGLNLMISLSKQMDISNVGKKGLIIGGDDQWDYFYSDKAGLNNAALGWVDSYVYNSQSVSFYLENPSNHNSVRVGVFKWLRAGWSNINFVERAHIEDGLERFASVLKQIVEHPSISDTPSWTHTLLEIQHLPKAQLQTLVKDYLQNIQKQAQSEGNPSLPEIKAMTTGGLYLNRLDREEMQAILTIEFLKQLLGKPSQLNFK